MTTMLRTSLSDSSAEKALRGVLIALLSPSRPPASSSTDPASTSQNAMLTMAGRGAGVGLVISAPA